MMTMMMVVVVVVQVFETVDLYEQKDLGLVVSQPYYFLLPLLTTATTTTTTTTITTTTTTTRPHTDARYRTCFDQSP